MHKMHDLLISLPILADSFPPHGEIHFNRLSLLILPWSISQSLFT